MDLNTITDDSLLYMDSPPTGKLDEFKTMKGLEHLAKLSIAASELKTYNTEHKP